MNEFTVAVGKEKYIYIINGVISEAMPPVAYRRAGRPELAVFKTIKCPYCRGILTTVERHTRIQIYRIPKGKRMAPIPGQIFKKCHVCKGEVGIVML